MTTQSGHVKSVRSTADVSHDGPNLPDVCLPGGMHPQRHETRGVRQPKNPYTCSLQATDILGEGEEGGTYFVVFVLRQGGERVYLVQFSLTHSTLTEPN